MPNTLKSTIMIGSVLAVALGSAAALSAQGILSSGQHATGSAKNAGGGPGVVPDGFANLKIAPGYLLTLEVIDDSDFDGSYRVDDKGNIAIPSLPLIHVAGDTVAEAREELRKAFLSAQLLKNPRLNLTIQEYTAPQVTILGEVLSPGKYPLLTPRNLVEVLALAGGETVNAGDKVEITHSDGTAENVDYKRSTNAKSMAAVDIRPGDTVQVTRAGIVYVTGAVNRPGGFIMQEDGTLNLLQAISLASGTSPLARTATVYVLRKQKDGSTVYIALPYQKIVKGKSADVQLQATDIIYVPTSKLKSIYQSTQFIIDSAATSAIYRY